LKKNLAKKKLWKKRRPIIARKSCRRLRKRERSWADKQAKKPERGHSKAEARKKREKKKKESTLMKRGGCQNEEGEKKCGA